MADPISIFVVDDVRLLRDGLVSLLAEQDDLTVIGTASNGSTALAKIRELRPEIALIDISMPGKDGITVTRALRQELPEIKVIILGMPDLTDEIMACIEAGAAGYVLKEASFDYLVETIRAVHRGESFCSPAWRPRCSRASRSWPLNACRTYRKVRLLIAAALAYLWMIYLGTLAQVEDCDCVIHRAERCDLSLFQLACACLSIC